MIFTLDIAALPEGYGEALLPLAAAKAHLGVLEDDDDDLIEALRDAAIVMVENYTGLILGPRTGADALVWRAEGLPAPGCSLALGVRPVTAIDSVAYLDSDGAEAAVDVETLRIVGDDGCVPVTGSRWPYASGGVVVTFSAGLADGAAPAPLIAAARMFLATLYMQRETVVVGTISGEVPQGFKMLCQPYRRLRV